MTTILNVEELNGKYGTLLHSFKDKSLYCVTSISNGSFITYFETIMKGHNTQHQSLISALKVYNDEKT